MLDDLERDLDLLRIEWRQHVEAGDDNQAGHALAVALGRCQARGRLLPQWLYEAISDLLWPVTGRDLAQLGNDKTALRRMQMVVNVLDGADKPSAKHFKVAAARLNLTGDMISWGGVKKLWQRDGDVFLALIKLRHR